MMTDARTRRILTQHVETDRLLGVEVMPYRHHDAVETDNAVTEGHPVETPPPMPTRRPTPQSAREPANAQPADPSAAAPQVPESTEVIPVGERAGALAQIDEQQVRGCTKCGLCQSRRQTVFGEGSVEASIMFIGEGPGYDEDQAGRPFVGRAGELLEKMIRAMGYSRQSVYIANLVKCRPPGNRTPTPEEVGICWGYLQRQIEIVRPTVIVTLGAPASKQVLGVDTGITRLRGNWQICRAVNPAVPVMPTFHPSYVQRYYTKETRGKVWSDLQQVLERVKSVG